jgi:5-methylcytosine-specific restriction endonuclease McrA
MTSEKKKIRARFRDGVFERDKHKCVFCTCTENLDAHHITDRSEMPNGGYVRSNGITLCSNHHVLAEHFHISGGVEWTIGMHPDDLYARIGSSKEQAMRDSEKLSPPTS